MVEIPDSLRLLFVTSLETQGDRYVITIPELVENSALTKDENYRIALLPTGNSSTQKESNSGTNQQRIASESNRPEPNAGVSRQPESRKQTPPVEEGEIRSVTIDTLGDQGDGIDKVEQGFIVIVSGTQPSDQVDVEITDVKSSVAFADPIKDPTVR